MMPSSEFHQQHSDVPLFVDLDETLVRTDVALELLIRGLRSTDCMKMVVPALVCGDRAGLKHQLAKTVELQAELLPYNPAVVAYLQAARDAGRIVVLATAADLSIAHRVANHLGLFDDIIASEPGRNMKGQAKLKAIQDYLKGQGFEYLGDATADLPIWRAATLRGFVNPPLKAKELIEADPKAVSLLLNDKKPTSRSLIRAMRPHQWSKNALIFLPLLFSHTYTEVHNLLLSVLAFLSFSACASAVYLFNDLLDIEADRMHSSKCRRPFASGELNPVTGLLAGTILFLLSLVIGFFAVGPIFGLVLVGYIVMTKCYSIWLKKYSTVDVVALALLYTIRILAGAAAIMVPVSPWLLSFSLFFFLSLAYMKRFVELSRTKDGQPLAQRGYSASDLVMVQIIGIANGAVALLTLAQYINSPGVIERYRAPEILWLIIPLMMLWVYRAWMWASRGRIDDDPVVFALRDRSSQQAVLLAGVIVLGARLIDINWMLL